MNPKKNEIQRSVFRCVCCGETVSRNPRTKSQKYCSKGSCQRARKAKWQREQLSKDEDYKKNQQEAARAWRQKNPDYYKTYRKKNPNKTNRNRILQRLRRQGTQISKGKKNGKPVTNPIYPKMDLSYSVAKMDALTPSVFGDLPVFWLIPSVANMDAFKVLLIQ